LGEEPTQEGGVRYVNGGFKLRDSLGVYDPRAAGTGITEATHEGLDTLVHEIDETSYEEYTYSGNRVQGAIIWTSAAKTLKIREEAYTYSGGRISQVVTTQYNGSGASVMQMTETYTYGPGSLVATITRTKVP
jgi:hypothetical protein